MRICIMTTVPITLVFFYKGLIDYFIDKGFEVTIITSPDERFISKLPPRARYILIPMSRGWFTLDDLRAFIRIRRVLKEGGFDIVQYCTPKAAFLGSIASWLCRVPVRLYLMWGIYYTSQTGLLRMVMKATEKIICFFSTHVSPDSHGNRDFAIAEGLCSAEKISVVGEGSASGIDLDRFDPERLRNKRTEIRSDLNVPSDAIVIGFVGRLCRDKGINELVLAFKELLNKNPGLYLFLVGPMEGEDSEFVNAVREMLQNNRNILRVGYQDRPEEFLAAMDIFVLPSYREGFGVVNIEASAMRLPVISTDIPGPRDAVLNGKTGILVKPKSAEELQAALETMINDPSLRRDMGTAGREWAKRFEQKLLWKEIVIHREALLDKRRAPYEINHGTRDSAPVTEHRNVLVTGANGFIGRSLCAFLKERGYFVRGALRNKARDISGVDEYAQIGDIDELTDWRQALSGVDTVVHLAACVNITDDTKIDPIDLFRKVNALGTGHLARMAAKAGVKRFIFISSVRVIGEEAPKPYTEKDLPDPQDDYGISKLEAEDLLVRISGETGLDTVILRLPLVYGPVVKANFKNLVRIVGSGFPLPLKGINNRRSFLYLGNLIDAIGACITHPLAINETFLVSDGRDVSTPELIKMIASAMKKRVILFRLSPGILSALCKIAGRDKELEKLTRTLTVDISKIKNLLGWEPPFTMEEGIRETVKASRCPEVPRNNKYDKKG
ncbi:MAG: glycosyltransferase [Candidatus Omnitrophota bacterium]|jgi:nucleoside-diphosphate-sugar epimerase/glycosyltransferase involved in cell wall biosynthesis